MKGKSRKTIFIGLIAAIVLAAVGLIIFFRTADMRTYGKAQKQEQAEDYYGALDTYQLIPDYRDARTRIKECKYQIAIILEEEEEYSQAQMSFEYLGKYQDAPEHAITCKYLGAIETEKAGEYEKARSIFEELGDYEDAAEHLKECDYHIALAMEEEERYEEAIDAFTALGNFKDAPEHVLECQYQIASLYAYYKRYDEAGEMFRALGDYSDSADQVKECQYQSAVSLLDAGSVDQAMTIFESLGDYKDSQEHLKERQYQSAVKLFEEGSTDAALPVFESLGSYKESESYLQKCRYSKALVLELSGALREALSLFRLVGNYEEASDHVEELTGLLKDYEEATKNQDETQTQLDEALEKTLALLENEDAFWEPARREELGSAYEEVTASRNGYYQGEEPQTKNQYIQALEILRERDDAPLLKRLEEIMALVEEGEKRLALLEEAKPETVLERIGASEQIALWVSATEENDPEGLLRRGAVGAVYFSSPMVEERYAYEPFLDVLRVGADAGGVVEVYETNRAASKRAEAYAASSENWGVTNMGRILVRVSRLLSPEDQNRLSLSLLETLSMLEPGESIERDFTYVETLDLGEEEEDELYDFLEEEQAPVIHSLFEGDLSYDEVVTGHFRAFAPKDWVLVGTNSWDYYYPKSEDQKGSGYMAVKEAEVLLSEEEQADVWAILDGAAAELAQGREYVTDPWQMHGMSALWVKAGSEGDLVRGLVLYDQGYVLYVKTFDEGSFGGADAASIACFGMSTVTYGEDFVKTKELAFLQKGDYLRYTVLVQNAMEDKAIREPEFLMVAKNADGEVLAEGSFSFPCFNRGRRLPGHPWFFWMWSHLRWRWC